jgi:hypothetical protein
VAALPALLCLAAMAAGLAFDTREVPLEVLAAWCADPASPWRSMLRHWTTMPASHGLMLAAALVIPLPHAPRMQRVMCAFAMTAGMSASALLTPALVFATGLPPAAALLVGMAMGLASGLAASHFVRRRADVRWRGARGALLGARPHQP